MRKLLLLCAGILFFSHTGQATHLMGGELSYKTDSSGNIHFSCILYRNIYQQTFSLPPNLILADKDSTYSTSLVRVKIDTIAQLGAFQSTPPPAMIDRHFYEGTISAQTLSQICTDCEFWVYYCCRSTGIQNVTNVGSSKLPLSVSFNTNVASSNHGPVFLGAPIAEFPVNDQVYYNPMPYDADGDSLYWYMADTAYIQNYSPPASAAGGPLAIKPLNSEISWTPSANQYYLMGVIAEEYRNGVKIGHTYRETMMYTRADNLRIDYDHPTNAILQNGLPVVFLKGDSLNEIRFSFWSGNTANTLKMSAFGEPFAFDGSDATFTTFSNGTQDTLTGVFNWTPSGSLKNQGPFRLTFRMNDSVYSTDYTVLVHINSVVNTAEYRFSDKCFEIYPNPGSGEVKLLVHELFGEGNANLKVLDLHGKLVFSKDFKGIQPGETLPLRLRLGKGIYIFQLNGKDKAENHRVVIQ